MATESGETDRLLSTREKVGKVESVTRENIAKVLNRGDNLDDLQKRTEVLRQSADDFDFTARRLKRKMCWKNVKLWFILLFVLVVILIVLIIALVAAVQSNKKH